MTGVLPIAAAACTTAGVVAAVAGAAVGELRQAVRMALDLWLAAGLLRLSADVSWRALVIVTVVIVVRHLASPVVAAARVRFAPVRPMQNER